MIHPADLLFAPQSGRVPLKERHGFVVEGG
jgi:hypothetical protein